jgi:hypothetical protein
MAARIDATRHSCFLPRYLIKFIAIMETTTAFSWFSISQKEKSTPRMDGPFYKIFQISLLRCGGEICFNHWCILLA